MTPSKTIPHVKGAFLLGNVRDFKTDPLQAIINWQRDYGDLLSFNLGPQRFYLLSHPALAEQALVQQNKVFVKMYTPEKPKGLALVLGQGLVTSRGEWWRKQRQMIQPMLQRRNLTGLLPQMQAAGEAMLARWQALGAHVELDLGQELTQLTLEVITQTMFSTSVLDKFGQLAPALDTGLRYASKTLGNPLMPPLWVPTPANREFKQALALLDGLVYGLIKNRRENPGEFQDLLTMLLSAEQEGGGRLSDVAVRDEVMTIFTAGHETTATTLTWTLTLLAQHPDVLTKVQQELDAVLGGALADAETLPKLVYTRAVLDESMRIRPPAGIIMRRVSKDTVLDGYHLKAGSLAVINIYGIHHHPEFWPEPELFDPERFLTDAKRKYTYLPFGLGERVCVGNQFALFESVVLLSMILQRYELVLQNDDDVGMSMAVTIRPKRRVMMRLVER